MRTGEAATCAGFCVCFEAGEVPSQCWELTFYMYTQLCVVLLVSEHLLLLKRQLSPDLPMEKILGIVFFTQCIGQNAMLLRKSPSGHCMLYLTLPVPGATILPLS